MKKAIVPFLIIFTLLYLTACKKEDSSVSQLSLTAAKTAAIKKGEPVIFSLKNLSASSVTWSVSPATDAQIRQSGDTAASITFSRAGTYIVSAASGAGSASSSITVNDSTYTGTNTVSYTNVPLTGDQLKITASRVDSGSTSGLVLSATTTNTYSCLNSFLSSQFTVTGTDYKISFDGVRTPDAANCSSGKATVSGLTFIYPVTDGSHQLQMMLNGILYTGSFVKTGTSYTFTWPYSNDIIFSSLVIK